MNRLIREMEDDTMMENQRIENQRTKQQRTEERITENQITDNRNREYNRQEEKGQVTSEALISLMTERGLLPTDGIEDKRSGKQRRI
ncbi:MAG: hypothetical protein IJ801_01185 [Lachnospiraceae bacterium]|nr:hypothetical protein [Lachnospiraceae bacterium]